jgi:hypothetical protein
VPAAAILSSKPDDPLSQLCSAEVWLTHRAITSRTRDNHRAGDLQTPVAAEPGAYLCGPKCHHRQIFMKC